MKKLISMALCLAFAASCAAPAFAVTAPLFSETDAAPEYTTQAAMGMTEAEIQEYAHMDIDTAVNELEAKILSARNSFIFSKDWYDDSVPGGEPATWGYNGVEYVLPGFSTLFPADWKNPSNAERDIIKSVDQSILPKTQSEKDHYAYLDLDTETQALKNKIITARNELIYRQDWAADEVVAYYVDPTTGKSERLPKFSELFPNWDLPVEPMESTDAEESDLSGPEPHGYIYRNFGQVSIRPAQSDSPVNPFPQPLNIADARWLRLYANNITGGATYINLGFSYAGGQSIVHKRNVPNNGFLTVYKSSCSYYTIYARASHYHMSPVTAHLWVEKEPE